MTPWGLKILRGIPDHCCLVGRQMGELKRRGLGEVKMATSWKAESGLMPWDRGWGSKASGGI